MGREVRERAAWSLHPGRPAPAAWREAAMDVLHPRCAGLDVHKDFVVAAVRLAEPGGVRCEVRRFDTTTPGLLALGEWLAACGCTHAVMEATGAGLSHLDFAKLG